MPSLDHRLKQLSPTITTGLVRACIRVSTTAKHSIILWRLTYNTLPSTNIHLREHTNRPKKALNHLPNLQNGGAVLVEVVHSHFGPGRIKLALVASSRFRGNTLLIWEPVVTHKAQLGHEVSANEFNQGHQWIGWNELATPRTLKNCSGRKWSFPRYVWINLHAIQVHIHVHVICMMTICMTTICMCINMYIYIQ